MKIKDVMTKNAVFIAPDTPIRDAAQKMQEQDCGSLLVGENDRITGMITDRDIVVRAVADGLDVNDTLVEDVMTDDVVYCYEDDALESAADKMENEQVRRLAVLNDKQRDIQKRRNVRYIGTTLEVMVESRNEARAQWMGRTTQNKTLNFTAPDTQSPGVGTYVPVLVTRSFPNSLVGEMVV